MTATSVVPPPISTIMLPDGSDTGSPTPIAAAMGSSIRKISLAPARSALSFTARVSTSVIPEGTATRTRGLTRRHLAGTLVFAFWMKYRSIASVTSKSAITPYFMGRTALMFPGVLPSIRFASSPTARTSLLRSLIATTDGSFSTTPLSFT